MFTSRLLRLKVKKEIVTGQCLFKVPDVTLVPYFSSVII